MNAIDTAAGRIGLLQARPQDPTGLPILFLHGVGSDKSVWRPQLDHFGQTRHALAADYPGYGDSAPVEATSRDDYARAMIALLDAVAIDRAHICGLSLGGVVAIAMATLAPQRCASLIIADSFAVHPDGQGIYDRSTSAAQQIGMRALAEARVDVLLGDKPPAGLRDEVIETMAAIPVSTYAQGAEAVWLADQRERAAAIAIPTLIPCGDEDQVTPPALSRALSQLVKGSEVAIVKGAGHLANAERPDAFNSLVERFVSAAD
ncbi:alpha/beta fold hydrolase [Sphingomicrobium flavum]|uniref:alpha/beta fold hydrolase n=1 Tax=Sphingomicrobium flavum TaxID=1229164 RepID=UPI0021AD7E41|nr:alpha/beta fold hydrolase [Sphingomicrobium flavum]